MLTELAAHAGSIASSCREASSFCCARSQGWKWKVAVPVSWINNCQFISCTIKTLNMSQGPFWHTPLSPWIKCVVRCQSNVCQEESEKWYKFYSSGQDFFRTHLCCVSPWKYNGVSSALSACCRLAVQLTHQTDWLADMTQRDCLYILTDWLTDWRKRDEETETKKKIY